MHIAQWETAQRDDASMDTPAKIAAMQADKSNHSYVYQKDKSDPSSSWSMPYVTGKRYRVWWGVGLDWTQMQADLDGTWTADDPITHFTIPYVE